MAKTITVLVFLANIILSNGQEDQPIPNEYGPQNPHAINPNYSFGYGVADTHTGDIKTVWETKEGDTVQGHYSIMQPDGSMRSVEYSAGPKTGFTAKVNNDATQFHLSTEGRDMMEDKALRDYDKPFDSSESSALESYYNEKKRRRHPYENLFKEYNTLKKRPQYPSDMEPTDYTHSITIKHPHDETSPDSAAESHIGFNFDPNCKTKHKKEHSNSYMNVPDLEFRRQKYPSLSSGDNYKNEFEKYVSESSNMDKIYQMYKHNEKYKPLKQQDEFEDWPSIKNSYHGLPDIPSENIFSDYRPPRPKKKNKPHKKQEPIEVEDLDDYILVPKKKHKKPPRFGEPDEYRPDIDEEFEDPYDEDSYYKPPRASNQKEVVRKVVKKKKPVINILDIFDI